jgi:hypothetical protein
MVAALVDTVPVFGALLDAVALALRRSVVPLATVLTVVPAGSPQPRMGSPGKIEAVLAVIQILLLTVTVPVLVKIENLVSQLSRRLPHTSKLAKPTGLLLASKYAAAV